VLEVSGPTYYQTVRGEVVELLGAFFSSVPKETARIHLSCGPVPGRDRRAEDQRDQIADHRYATGQRAPGFIAEFLGKMSQPGEDTLVREVVG